MPAEIAVNSMVEKIQSSIVFLKRMMCRNVRVELTFPIHLSTHHTHTHTSHGNDELLNPEVVVMVTLEAEG